MKLIKKHTFADDVCDLRTRKINSIIDKDYKKGKSVSGKPSYDGLLLFKMCLLQTWYGLSDYEVEDRVNDSISFGCFCGLTIESRLHQIIAP